MKLAIAINRLSSHDSYSIAPALFLWALFGQMVANAYEIENFSIIYQLYTAPINGSMVAAFQSMLAILRQNVVYVRNALLTGNQCNWCSL